MEWSSTVQDYHPVSPRPRWGFGQPVHTEVRRYLDRYRATYEVSLDALGRHSEALYAVPYNSTPGIIGPFWNNVWFSCLDAASLVGFLLERRPKHYIEIGSGHSTQFARHAVNWGRLDTSIVSIDPKPRAEIDSLCDRVVRTQLEECPLETFDELVPGDILFFDGSHRVFTNSDATVLFFDILPRLRPGVLVHIHDIFWPADYPPQWNARLYSEQYLLGTMMLCGSLPFRIILPNYFCCTDELLSKKVSAIFDGRAGGKIPFLYDNGANIPGVSFWIETA